MEELREVHHQDALVDEIVCLVRTQIAAIAGNLLAVVPEFGLRVFQNPTGADMARLAGATAELAGATHELSEGS